MTPRVILDCDPGHDDAIALLLALGSPAEVELLGVTTVSGNQTLEKTTANAIRVLDHVGRDEIPVAAGADRPLIRRREVAENVHGETGLDDPISLVPPASQRPSTRSTGSLGLWGRARIRSRLSPSGRSRTSHCSSRATRSSRRRSNGSC